MSDLDHGVTNEARTRVVEWMDARTALGHRADVIGMIRRPSGEPFTLRVSDLRQLADMNDVAQSHPEFNERWADQ